MRLAAVTASIAISCCSRAAAQELTVPTATAPTIDLDAANREDFGEYKRRLFRLIVEFRRYRTTVPDIEEILGMEFRTREERYSQPGWIIGAAHGFKSLRMNHRISLYYEPVRFHAVRGATTIKQLQFATQYYVNFAQAEPPMTFYKDPARCLTVAELEASLTAAHLAFKISPPSDPDRRFLTVGFGDFLRPDGMSLQASIDLSTVRAIGGSLPAPELAHACIENVSVT